METRKRICRIVIEKVKSACWLPRSGANALKHRQEQVVLNGLESERLDRIRNPSKYLGK